MLKGGCLKKGLLGGVALVLIVVLALVIVVKTLSKPAPEGVPGEEAEALALAMKAAVNDEAWQATGAIRWDFGGRQQHLWDRTRHLARVRWDDVEVLVDLSKRTGLANRGGIPVTGAAAAKLVEKAWAFWANDAFWLNPIAKIHDEGTSRALVEVGDGLRGLLVSYSSGGVTPGDRYLWVVDRDNLPIRWEMWVSIIPIGGLKASWSDWQTLATGVKVAQTHDLGPFVLRLSEIEAAATLTELEPGEDPFAALLGEEPPEEN